MAPFSPRGAFTVAMTGPVLLGPAAGVMVGLLFYAQLVAAPPVAYIVGVLATAGVTGWAALECLLCDWTDRGGDGHRVQIDELLVRLQQRDLDHRLDRSRGKAIQSQGQATATAGLAPMI